jgi:cellulose synthase/poly-beta-1,6-N-acetylglucosamine synthase-like glycosyltransferase
MDVNSLLLTYLDTTRQVTVWYLKNNTIILDYLHTFFVYAFDFALNATIALASVYMLITLYRVLFIRKDVELPFIESKSPFVTVQIPTRNELAAINCARCVLESDYPLSKIQILIGDDSNQPDVSAKLNAFAAENSKHVKIVRRLENVGYKPGNLNNMLKYTRGEIIVIFDSDFLPKKDFIRRLVTPFIHDAALAATQARWTPTNSAHGFTSTLASSINNMFHFIFLPFMSHTSGSVCLCGSAEAVRRKLLVNDGGWQSGSLTEDIEYSMRLWQQNKKIKFLGELTCDMEVPYTPRDLFRQQMRWAFGVITAARMHMVNIVRESRIGLISNTGLLVSGYVLTALLMSLSILGGLSMITHKPEPIQWALFLGETLKNIVLTSGILVTYVVAEIIAKEWSKIPKVIVSSLSLGLIVTLYVNKGIFDALTNKGMKWYLVKKQGNNNHN